MGQVLSKLTLYKPYSASRPPKSCVHPTTAALDKTLTYCGSCVQVGRFIQECVELLRLRGLIKLSPHLSILLGHLDHLRARRDCAGCQSIVSALIGAKEVTEPDLLGLDARLRFDGNVFLCDLYPHGEEPSSRRGPMLIQTEPADPAQRIPQVKYGRFMDPSRIDTDLIRSWIETCDSLHGDGATHNIYRNGVTSDTK